MSIPHLARRAAWRPLAAACAAGAVALGVAAGLPAVAAAAPPAPRDPLDANVPALAWRGEQLKLATCIGHARSAELQAQQVAASAFRFEEFLVEDWSGTDPDRGRPQVKQSTQRAYVDDRGRFCFAADVISLHAGIAPIKLVVSHDGTPVLEHQFLAIWMTQRTPRLTRLDASDDPHLGGDLFAGGAPAHLRVTVSGTVPLHGTFAELGLGSQITLPDDYPALARRMARGRNPATDRNPLLWDVHDDTTTRLGHPHGPCGPRTADLDAVDACLGGGDTGRFSAFDALTGVAFLSSTAAIGPFDPTRADDTFLPDGALATGDAQMPPLRVDVSIAPNSGQAHDTSGIGTLAAVDKSRAYSRNGLGTGNPHNLYAPFYKAFIPATAAGESSSGTSGPSPGSNFPGYLNDNPYAFWDVAHVLRSAAGGRTDCRIDDRRFRQRPKGPQAVVVSSDEHGEAQIAFVPGVDAYYDALVRPDRNGGCDLQGVNPIGAATIEAITRYPYQPVTDPDRSTGTLTRRVLSRFSKTLSYEPKGTTASTANVRIVTAHAQDVDGTPFRGELVCFSHDANAQTIIAYGPFEPVRDPLGGGRLCVRTDARGNAVVEVLNSNRSVTNVIAHFVDERLFRDVHVDFRHPTSSGGTPPPSPSVPGGHAGPHVPPPAGVAGTTVPTAVELVRAGVPSRAVAHLPRAKKGPRKATLGSAHLKRSPRGRAWVVLRVNGRRGAKAQVRIRVLARGGRTIKRISRSVPTNRRVKVPLGKVSRRARAVRVSVR